MKVTITENGRTIEFEVPNEVPEVSAAAEQKVADARYDFGLECGLELAMDTLDELIETREERYNSLPKGHFRRGSPQARAATAERTRVFASVLWLKKAKQELQKGLTERRERGYRLPRS